MRVLFVSHTSEVSGAEHSLIALIEALPVHVTAFVACPPGEFAESLRAREVTVDVLGGVAGGPRLGLATIRAVRNLLEDALRVTRLTRQHGADLVHANSLRSAVIGCLAGRFGGPPVIAHVRDCFPSGEPLTRIARAFVARYADAVVFNSRHTRCCFANGIGRLVRRAPWTVIPNGVDVQRFKPGLGRVHARRQLGVEHRAIVLGVIGQVSPWKAHDDAVCVLATLLDHGHDAHLLIVGATKFVKRGGRFDHVAYAAEIRDLVHALDLRDRVSLLGERSDVPMVLEAVDIVLVPSWQEPFGRIVIEAMAMETPVVATSIGGPSEVIRHGCDGILLPPRAVQTWARALDRLLREPERMSAMGRSGRQRVVECFNVHRHAAQVLAVYEQVLSGTH